MALMAFMNKLVLIDTQANLDAQRDNLAPDIAVYAADNVPDANAKTDFYKMEFFVKWNHPTHSVTQRTHCNDKQKTFASRMIPMFLN
jgi:hypothetical protein